MCSSSKIEIMRVAIWRRIHSGDVFDADPFPRTALERKHDPGMVPHLYMKERCVRDNPFLRAIQSPRPMYAVERREHDNPWLHAIFRYCAHSYVVIYMASLFFGMHAGDLVLAAAAAAAVASAWGIICKYEGTGLYV
jgi:hypothetical protein